MGGSERIGLSTDIVHYEVLAQQQAHVYLGGGDRQEHRTSPSE